MRLYYDKATNRLVRKPGYTGDLTRIAVKRGDKLTLDLGFYDGQTAANITGTKIVFAVKMAGADPLLAIADAWAEASGLYSAALDTNTQAILDEMGASTSIAAVCELTYSEDDGVTWTSSQTVDITIHDDVYSGVEGTPVNVEDPEGWLEANGIRIRADLTELVGGTSTDVDGLDPADFSDGDMIALYHDYGVSTQLDIYKYVEGTAKVTARPQRIALVADTTKQFYLVGVGGAYQKRFFMGDKTGDESGDGSFDIQSQRAAPTQAATGNSSIAFGERNTASATRSFAIGYENTASDTDAWALGYKSVASDSNSIAFGYECLASADKALAFGYQAKAEGTGAVAIGPTSAAGFTISLAMGWSANAGATYATAIGGYAETTVTRTTELSAPSGSSRGAAVRMHGLTGMVSMTLQNTATAYTDGGAVKGAETDGTILREGFAIRRNGDDILIDINIGGTIKTLNLGTAV